MAEQHKDVRVVKMGVDYSSINILCTREIEKSYLHLFSSKGINMDVIPFIATLPLVNNYLIQKINELAVRPITAIFTSANAVKAVANLLGKQSVNWTFACLDKATNYEVQHHFPDSKIVITAKDATLLSQSLVAAQHECNPFVFFCGSKSLNTIPTVLATNDIAMEQLMVYQTQIKSAPIEKYYNGILFMSPSAVDSYFVCNNFPKNAVAFCIGATTADALTKKLSQPVVVVQAAEHSVASLLESILVYYNR